MSTSTVASATCLLDSAAYPSTLPALTIYSCANRPQLLPLPMCLLRCCYPFNPCLARPSARVAAGPDGMALLNDLPKSLALDISQWMYMEAILQVLCPARPPPTHTPYCHQHTHATRMRTQATLDCRPAHASSSSTCVIVYAQLHPRPIPTAHHSHHHMTNSDASGRDTNQQRPAQNHFPCS
jgi:hypothetical protein